MANEGAKPRRSCLFYGGITAAVLLVLALIAALLGLRMAKKMFNQFTDTKPIQFPAVQMSPAQIASVQQRVDTFREAVRAHRPRPPLALTPDEMNALITTDPDMQALKGKLYITAIQGDQLKAQLSVPMEQAGLPMFQGHYLNGTGTFAISLRNGLLRITPQAFEAKGKPLPEVYMEKVRKQNLAKSINSNPRVSVALDWLQEIQVKDGKLVIVPKENQ